MKLKHHLRRYWLSPAISNAVVPSLVLLIFRLSWGWELIESGWGHWHPIAGFISRLSGWGVPYPVAGAYLSATTELLGGVLLMLGLGTRFIAIPVVINFCVAYKPNLSEVTQFFHQDPANFINDTAFPFLITALLLLAFGAGLFSLDYLALLLTDKQPIPFWRKLFLWRWWLSKESPRLEK